MSKLYRFMIKHANVLMLVFGLLTAFISAFPAPAAAAPAAQENTDPSYGHSSPQWQNASTNSGDASIQQDDQSKPQIAGDPRWYRRDNRAFYNIFWRNLPENTIIEWIAKLDGRELNRGSVTVSGTHDSKPYELFNLKNSGAELGSCLELVLTTMGNTTTHKYCIPQDGPVFGWAWYNPGTCEIPGTVTMKGQVDPYNSISYGPSQDGPWTEIDYAFLGEEKWEAGPYNVDANWPQQFWMRQEFFGKQDRSDPRGNKTEGPYNRPPCSTATSTSTSTPTAVNTPSPTNTSQPLTPSVAGTLVCSDDLQNVNIAVGSLNTSPELDQPLSVVVKTPQGDKSTSLNFQRREENRALWAGSVSYSGIGDYQVVGQIGQQPIEHQAQRLDCSLPPTATSTSTATPPPTGTAVTPSPSPTQPMPSPTVATPTRTAEPLDFDYNPETIRYVMCRPSPNFEQPESGEWMRGIQLYRTNLNPRASDSGHEARVIRAEYTLDGLNFVPFDYNTSMYLAIEFAASEVPLDREFAIRVTMQVYNNHTGQAVDDEEQHYFSVRSFNPNNTDNDEWHIQLWDVLSQNGVQILKNLRGQDGKNELARQKALCDTVPQPITICADAGNGPEVMTFDNGQVPEGVRALPAEDCNTQPQAEPTISTPQEDNRTICAYENGAYRIISIPANDNRQGLALSECQPRTEAPTPVPTLPPTAGAVPALPYKPISPEGMAIGFALALFGGTRQLNGWRRTGKTAK